MACSSSLDDRSMVRIFDKLHREFRTLYLSWMWSTVLSVRIREGFLTIISVIAFDEAPPVHVNNHAFGPVFTSQQVESTNTLPKSLTNLSRPELLRFGEMCHEASVRNKFGWTCIVKCSLESAYRISFPSVFRLTTPSTTGDLRVSA